MTPATCSAPGTRRSNLLAQVQIASPCTASWDEMTGTDRVRFCGQCAKNVYNISAMTSDEAERLIVGAEGRLCVRLFKRHDGTVLTQDCPRGLERVRRRMKWAAGLVTSFLAAAAGGLFMASRPTRTVVQGEMAVMGDVAPVQQPEQVQPRDTEPRPMMGAAAPIHAPRELMGKIASPRPPRNPLPER